MFSFSQWDSSDLLIHMPLELCNAAYSISVFYEVQLHLSVYICQKYFYQKFFPCYCMFNEMQKLD